MEEENMSTYSICKNKLNTGIHFNVYIRMALFVFVFTNTTIVLQ